MPAIITITLNPAIDKSTTIPALVPEKKIRCNQPVFEPGGGGVNVARAIKKLGGNALAVYLAGGYSGQFYTTLLQQEDIHTHVISISQHTRENLIVHDASSALQYRFGMPGPVVEKAEWEALLSAIEKNHAEFIVASGSVPAGVPPDIFARMARIAKKQHSRLVVDTSGEALQFAADEGVYMLKPNLGELSALAGHEELGLESVEQVAREMIALGKCEVIVVSMGPAGAMLVTKDLMHTITPPPVKRKSTVGAGDSMVAGIVLQLSRGKELLEAVQYGVASGTAATMNAGTALCLLQDVEKLYTALRR